MNHIENMNIYVKSYFFDIKFVPARKLLEIKALIDIKKNRCLTNLVLLLNSDANIISIKNYCSENLNYLFKNNKLTIFLSHRDKLSKNFSIIIEYLLKTNHFHQDIWKRYDSLWYPAPKEIQFSKFECVISVPKEYIAITHGVLFKSEYNSKNAYYHFIERKPISRFSLIIGNYHKIENHIKNPNLIFYLKKKKEIKYIDDFQKRIYKILSFYNKLFCKYPFKNLNVIELSNLNKAGYSDASLIMLNSKNLEAISDKLIAHEIAHQWWGNLFIPCSPSEEILNESFAEFFSLFYLEKKFNLALIKPLLEMQRSSKGKSKLFLEYLTFLDRLKDSIGEQEFLKEIKNFVLKNKFKVAKIKDMESGVIKNKLDLKINNEF